ncbi:zinc-finger homeodomain protein 6-like [Salvia splendens]|uniref:zinc-finger homeodomain protein 6-like n=1 Tax=Salvia splendens TaxID=180675 RepID=UPI001103F792|nr:zinc-finger homeodomain protein 6-like [Salvia splendens]
MSEDKEMVQLGSDPHSGGSKRPIYRECLKNHAATVGGNVTDGCGEFMSSGEDGLKCAACSCHRNFHRREPVAVHPLQLPSPSMSQYRHWSPMVHPVKMAFAAATDSSNEELNFHAAVAAAGPPPPLQFAARKRFRTKFTAEQKEKMLEFAEKLGWRIPREDDTSVQRFCAEVGVKRQVFKVWMHNNNTSSSKKIPQQF